MFNCGKEKHMRSWLGRLQCESSAKGKKNKTANFGKHSRILRSVYKEKWNVTCGKETTRVMPEKLGRYRWPNVRNVSKFGAKSWTKWNIPRRLFF